MRMNELPGRVYGFAWPESSKTPRGPKKVHNEKTEAVLLNVIRAGARTGPQIEKQSPVGKSATYRALCRMVRQGTISRQDNGRGKTEYVLR